MLLLMHLCSCSLSLSPLLCPCSTARCSQEYPIYISKNDRLKICKLDERLKKRLELAVFQGGILLCYFITPPLLAACFSGPLGPKYQPKLSGLPTLRKYASSATPEFHSCQAQRSAFSVPASFCWSCPVEAYTTPPFKVFL